MHRACVLAGSLAATPAPALELDFVLVGDAGNPADTTGLGSVPYDVVIWRYVISNAAYVAFLNEVATESDPHGLYDPQMPIDFPPVPPASSASTRSSLAPTTCRWCSSRSAT
jgi:hypothetical protein